MTLTIYVPQAGGINGGGIMADGNKPKIGYVACGPRYPFGTVFEILIDDTDDVNGMPHGLPRVFECRDRGRMVGNKNLDMVLMGEDVRRLLASARQWGKRRLPVRVWKNWETYHAADPPV
jgi:hypothetical protein